MTLHTRIREISAYNTINQLKYFGN
jgi:hypothetical protein